VIVIRFAAGHLRGRESHFRRWTKAHRLVHRRIARVQWRLVHRAAFEQLAKLEEVHSRRVSEQRRNRETFVCGHSGKRSARLAGHSIRRPDGKLTITSCVKRLISA
jgi:hypothetical protein